MTSRGEGTTCHGIWRCVHGDLCHFYKLEIDRFLGHLGRLVKSLFHIPGMALQCIETARYQKVVSNMQKKLDSVLFLLEGDSATAIGHVDGCIWAVFNLSFSVSASHSPS